MSHAKRTHPLEGLIADYLNGHLPDADTERLDLAMAQDSKLREMVAFERNIQSTITSEQVVPMHVPQFAKIADKLDGSSASHTSRWLTWGSSFAVVMLVAVIVAYLPQAEQPINQFEMLSDTPVIYDKPVLRIMHEDSLDESALVLLLNDYDLKMVKRYADANAMDVISNTSTQLELIAKQLKQDKRVKLIQLKQGQ